MPASPTTIPAEYRSPNLRYPAKSDRNRYSAPMAKALLSDLTDRARNIFCTLVEAYLETGNPIGARPLAKRLSFDLSPATVRNVMQDLEEMNLLASPHTSAGRLPSEAGLRLFVDALLELGLPPSEDSGEIVAAVTGEDISTQRLLANAGRMLSGLSRGASLVLAPTEDKAIDHAEFIRVGDGNALVALAMEDGSIENRLFDAPPGMTPSSMQEAANFLNAHLRGCTLSEARSEIARRMEADQRQIDSAARRLVEAGMASWEGVEGGPGPDDCARSLEPARERSRGGGPRPAAIPARRSRTPQDGRPAPGSGPGRAGRAGLYRLRESLVFAFGFLSDNFSLYEW